MHVTRVHADERGETHFEDVEIDWLPTESASSGTPRVSSPLVGTRLRFAEFPAGWLGPWHPAPRRQYWVAIGGEVEVTVSDGEVRVFESGSIALLEDLAGKGHVTRVVCGRSAQALLIEF